MLMDNLNDSQCVQTFIQEAVVSEIKEVCYRAVITNLLELSVIQTARCSMHAVDRHHCSRGRRRLALCAVKVAEALTQSDHRGINSLPPILTTLLIPRVSLLAQV